MGKCPKCSAEYIGEVANPCRICGPRKPVVKEANIKESKERKKRGK